MKSVDDRAADAQHYLLEARAATAAARDTKSTRQAEAMIRIAQIWLDLAGEAMSDVLTLELRGATAND